MGLVNGCLYVLWRRGPSCNTIGEKGRACSRVLLSLNTEHQFTAFLSQRGLTMARGEISMHRWSVSHARPDLYVAGSGPVPGAPGAPCIRFWLLRYNEGAGAWLLRGRVAPLQPWPEREQVGRAQFNPRNLGLSRGSLIAALQQPF